MRRAGRLPILLLALCAACSGGGGAPASPPRSLALETLTVEGWITELEDDILSVRLYDGRQLIFSIEEPPVTRDYLAAHMEGRLPIRVTYRAIRGQLIPLEIEDACPSPAPDCASRPGPSPA